MLLRLLSKSSTSKNCPMTLCHGWLRRGLAMVIALVVIATSCSAISQPVLAEDRSEGRSERRDQEGPSRAALHKEAEFRVNPSGNRWSLDLNHLTTLSVESAEALARHRAGTILLDGLTSISAQQAEALAKHRGRCLSLRGVQTLSEEAAAHLASYRGALLLDGVTHLTDGAIGGLAQTAGSLSLCGLTSLSTPGAHALACRRMPGLSLNGLKDVSVDVAAELARHRGPLRLDGLTTLSEDVARTLAAHGSELSLAALTTLSTDAAVNLARHRGGLSLDGLTTVSPALAAVLARYGEGGDPSSTPARDASTLERAFRQAEHRPRQEGMLMLRGLHSLESPPLAEKLMTQERQRAAKHGDAPVLRLNSLTTVSDDVLVILTGFPGTLCLDGLTMLSPPAARTLVQHRGGLQLNGLTRITPDTAQVLSQYGHPWLFDGINAYLGSAIGYYSGRSSVAEHAESVLSLNGLRVLDSPSLAATLAAQEEQRSRRHYDDPALKLDHVADLSDNAAKTLAAFKGTLCLNGLRSLSRESAKALATHRGRLELNGLRVVSDEAAVELARHQGDLSLRGARTLSALAADVLAANASVSVPVTVRMPEQDRAAADGSPLPDR